MDKTQHLTPRQWALAKQLEAQSQQQEQEQTVLIQNKREALAQFKARATLAAQTRKERQESWKQQIEANNRKKQTSITSLEAPQQTMKKKSWLKRLSWKDILCWTGVALMLPFLLLVSFSDKKISIITSNSVDFRIALLEAYSPRTTLQNGDYIRFLWRGTDPNQQGLTPEMPLLKKVACTEGQYLIVRAKEAFCDGHPIGLVRDKNLKGEILKPFLYEGVIPQGKLFVMGDTYGSYDSRYFGLIDRWWITERVVGFS